MNKQPIYFDNHSTTRVDPLVVEAMLPYFTEFYGNPSNKNNQFGWEANSVVNKARGVIAGYLNADVEEEIYFTSGATESINIVHQGLVTVYSGSRTKIITSNIEHSAVLTSLSELAKYGYDIEEVKVDGNGNLNYDELKEKIDDNTFLVSIMAVNNEIGTINDLERIGEFCSKNGAIFHTDASQAIGKTVIDVNKFKLDAVSLTGHKFYAPKGIGALYLRNKKPKLNIHPLVFGGGQEKGIRPGTLNVPLIAGLGKAVELLIENSDEINKITELRDRLQENLVNNLKNVVVNGDKKNRVGNNLNISFLGVRSENFISSCREVAVSTGAACSSDKPAKSHVLKALNIDEERMASAIRFGLGRFNTLQEVETGSKIIIETINKLRENSPVYQLKYQEQ